MVGIFGELWAIIIFIGPTFLEIPKGISNNIHSNPCRIPISLFIQGHLLGHGPQTIVI
jgi:hypothetical protein